MKWRQESLLHKLIENYRIGQEWKGRIVCAKNSSVIHKKRNNIHGK